MKRSGLRLAGGPLKGRRIIVPAGVRPTEARVREALLSIWRERLDGARFLDLFAGSGAVGLEAAALGARQVVFVEAGAGAMATLQKNARGLGPDIDSDLGFVRGRLPEVLGRRPEGCFDLLFADPPYEFSGHQALLSALHRLAAPGAIAALEHSVRQRVEEDVDGWRFEDRKRYGESCLSFFALRG